MAELYCPHCRAKCGVDSCPTDAKGACACCGKVPVAWADREKKWLWCDAHKQWHEKPCVEDAKRHCCHAA